MTHTTPTIIPVILCGGMGSRLWPLSRKHYPKQFLALDGEDSMLQQTVARVSGKGFGRPVVVTNQDHRFLVAQHLQEKGCEADIILEPTGRNTAPAITAAALHIREKYNHAIMLVLPSDHVIRDESAFHEAVVHAALSARTQRLVTFGITPHYAETGYGYIRLGTSLEGLKSFEIAQFVEKPDAKTAQSYLDQGDYLWNSGMFMFPCELFIEEMLRFQPDIVTHVAQALHQGVNDPYFVQLQVEAFSQAHNISIDYAVMEHTKRAAIVPVECGWNDAGAWDAVWRIAAKNDDNNVSHGDIISHNTSNCYLRQDGGAAIATVGVDNLVIISTGDMVLVAHKDHAQDVKHVMQQAQKQHTEWVEHHPKVHRPWGFYEKIQTGERHQVKRIHVNPGARLSVQKHHHRAEHWVIVSGTAKVLVGEEEQILTDNQHVHIPLGEVHCVENIGKIPLLFIEVQQGSYLGEDDIVRFEDRYGRVGSPAALKRQPYKPTLVEPADQAQQS